MARQFNLTIIAISLLSALTQSLFFFPEPAAADTDRPANAMSPPSVSLHGEDYDSEETSSDGRSTSASSNSEDNQQPALSESAEDHRSRSWLDTLHKKDFQVHLSLGFGIASFFDDDLDEIPQFRQFTNNSHLGIRPGGAISTQNVALNLTWQSSKKDFGRFVLQLAHERSGHDSIINSRELLEWLFWEKHFRNTSIWLGRRAIPSGGSLNSLRDSHLIPGWSTPGFFYAETRTAAKNLIGLGVARHFSLSDRYNLKAELFFGRWELKFRQAGNEEINSLEIEDSAWATGGGASFWLDTPFETVIGAGYTLASATGGVQRPNGISSDHSEWWVSFDSLSRSDSGRWAWIAEYRQQRYFNVIFVPAGNTDALLNAAWGQIGFALGKERNWWLWAGLEWVYTHQITRPSPPGIPDGRFFQDFPRRTIIDPNILLRYDFKKGVSVGLESHFAERDYPHPIIFNTDGNRIYIHPGATPSGKLYYGIVWVKYFF